MFSADLYTFNVLCIPFEDVCFANIYFCSYADACAYHSFCHRPRKRTRFGNDPRTRPTHPPRRTTALHTPPTRCSTELARREQSSDGGREESPTSRAGPRVNTAVRKSRDLCRRGRWGAYGSDGRDEPVEIVKFDRRCVSAYSPDRRPRINV